MVDDIKTTLIVVILRTNATFNYERGWPLEWYWNFYRRNYFGKYPNELNFVKWIIFAVGCWDAKFSPLLERITLITNYSGNWINWENTLGKFSQSIESLMEYHFISFDDHGEKDVKFLSGVIYKIGYESWKLLKGVLSVKPAQRLG